MASKNTMEISEDFIASAYVSDRYYKKLDQHISMEPYGESSLTDSMDSIEKFIRSQYMAGEPAGIEVVYDGANTGFNIAFNGSNDKTTENLINTDEAEIGADTHDYKVELDTDKYISGGRLRFKRDNWFPMKLDEYTSDPLQDLVTSLSENGNADQNVIIQYTFEPIQDNKWNRRFSLRYMFRPIWEVPMITFGESLSWQKDMIVDVLLPLLPFNFFKVPRMMKRAANITVDHVKKTIPALYKSVSSFTGYTNKDFTNSLQLWDNKYESKKDGEIESDNPFYEDLITNIWLNFMGLDGTKSKATEEMNSQISSLRSQVDEKINDNGFVVEARVIVYGDDQDDVDERFNSIQNTIQNIYSTSENDASVQQGVVVDRATDRSRMKELLIETTMRRTGVDIHGRMRNPYLFRSWHTNRNRPMIMTPKEISRLVRLPSTDVTDRSISTTTRKVGGEMPSFE